LTISAQVSILSEHQIESTNQTVIVNEK